MIWIYENVNVCVCIYIYITNVYITCKLILPNHQMTLSECWRPWWDCYTTSFTEFFRWLAALLFLQPTSEKRDGPSSNGINKKKIEWITDLASSFSTCNQFASPCYPVIISPWNGKKKTYCSALTLKENGHITRKSTIPNINPETPLWRKVVYQPPHGRVYIRGMITL